MKPTWIIGIIIVFAILVVGALWYLGFIRLPGMALSPGDEDAPPGSVYCGYTHTQIIDMIELVSGKVLNNEVGTTLASALNMQACGSNDETTASVVAHYTVLNSDWYLLDDTYSSGSGWTSRNILWGNEATLVNSTLIKAIMVGAGTSVKSAYGYDVITATADGTRLAYVAFILWVANS